VIERAGAQHRHDRHSEDSCSDTLPPGIRFGNEHRPYDEGNQESALVKRPAQERPFAVRRVSSCHRLIFAGPALVVLHAAPIG
jgi:hypothetical protein